MAKPGRPKGLPKTGGRKKNVENVITADLKAMTMGALTAVGGQAYLENIALTEPVAFMSFLGKFVPKDVKNTLNGEISLKAFTEITYKVIEPNVSSRTKDSA